jgi:SHS2 domain-containing protein
MGKDPLYTLFNHTADLGLMVKADSCEYLFKNAGLALMDLIILNKSHEPGVKTNISVNGTDLPDLMVKWLSELLYLFEGERLIITDIRVNSLSLNNINSTVDIVKFDSGFHEVLREIKAVTYHQIEVKEEMGLWTARVIFDL